MATKGKKSGLGRGLDALFADREVAVNEAIKLPPFQIGRAHV